MGTQEKSLMTDGYRFKDVMIMKSWKLITHYEKFLNKPWVSLCQSSALRVCSLVLPSLQRLMSRHYCELHQRTEEKPVEGQFIKHVLWYTWYEMSYLHDIYPSFSSSQQLLSLCLHLVDFCRLWLDLTPQSLQLLQQTVNQHLLK